MKYIIPAVLIAVVLTACKKNSFYVTDRTDPAGMARVKMALFSTTATTTNVLISLNNERVSNIQPNFNAAYPGGGFNTNGNTYSDFLVVAPGEAKIDLDVPNTGTPVSQLKYYTGNTSPLQADKRYVVIVCDTGANTTNFVVDADTPTPDSGYSTLKFSHAMPNVAAVDVYKGATAGTATILFTNVKYKESSNYAVFGTGTDSIFCRVAGAPATATPIARRAFTFANQRIYSVMSRGYDGITTGNRTATIAAVVIQ